MNHFLKQALALPISIWSPHMLKKMFSAYWPVVIVLLVINGVSACSAPMSSSKESLKKSDSDSSLSSKLVKTGLYLISGCGGNSLLRFSPYGLILVNGKLPGNYHALMSQVRKISRISDLPVRALIVTNHHETHTGNNAEFIKAGIPIIAQDNLKTNLANLGPSLEKFPPPTITYTNDYTLKLGGVEAKLMHFGRASTNNDTVVYFPNLKVIAVGDLFTFSTPIPDFLAGGSLVGWRNVLNQILMLDFDVAIPSIGSTVRKTDLIVFKTKIDTVISRATELVKRRIPKDQLMLLLKTDDIGWQFNFTGNYLDRFYAELTKDGINSSDKLALLHKVKTE
jgi:cyclase